VMHTVVTTQKARKVHHCEVCPVPIMPGETYVRRVTFDGTANTFKTCYPCNEAFELAWLEGYDDGELMCADAIHEWADENRAKDPIAADLIYRIKWKRAP